MKPRLEEVKIIILDNTSMLFDDVVVIGKRLSEWNILITNIETEGDSTL